MATKQAAFDDILNRDEDQDDEIDYLENRWVTEEGSEINTRVNEDGVEEEQCPTCGSWYQEIGYHWSHPSVSCFLPSISQKRYEMIIGLVMGDGCIAEGSKNYYLDVSNTNKKFMKYLDSKLGWLTNGVRCKKTAQEKADSLSSRGIGGEERNTNPKNCYDQYGLRTRYHPIFNKLRQWYKNNGLEFQEVKYTKNILRMWYVSDGTLRDSGRIQMGLKNEMDRKEYIESLFDDIGIDVNLSCWTLYFSFEATKKMFEFIGDPPMGMEDKWGEEYEV